MPDKNILELLAEYESGQMNARQSTPSTLPPEKQTRYLVPEHGVIDINTYQLDELIVSSAIHKGIAILVVICSMVIFASRIPREWYSPCSCISTRRRADSVPEWT